jgi:hypothetical protein
LLNAAKIGLLSGKNVIGLKRIKLILSVTKGIISLS